MRPNAKLISINSVDLDMKSNFQDFQRYQPVDISISADAEATLPSLIEAVKMENDTGPPRGCREARAGRTGGLCAKQGSGHACRCGCGGVECEPGLDRAHGGRALAADQERGLGARLA